jgi:diguanylate cyclase (GGDEF)-like protein/PAS domain S-box-containing protein
MKDFAEISSDWMWETDANHNMSWITDAVERATGNPASSYIGKSRMDFAMRVASDPLFKKHVEDLNAHRPFRDLIYSVTGTDGKLRWIRVDGNPRFDEDGTFLGYRGTGSNITEEVEAREAAAQRAADLGEAHRLGRMGAWRYERTTRSATLSPEFLELVQLNPGLAVVPVKKLLRNFSSSTRRLIQSAYVCVARFGAEQTIDIEWELGAGRSIDLTVRAKPERDGDGRIVGVFGTVQDISERKAAERQLENLAYFDPLTGLGNRAYFARELAGRFRSLTGYQNTSDKLSSAQSGLMLLDLDHFKEVNDTLGHAAGDELLRRVADRLKRCVGPDAIVCRLGGDEFAIIIPDVQSRAAFGSLATDINAAFAGTVRLNEGAVHIATSIGLVVFPQQTSDPDEAMRFADLALYRAKEEGRSRWMFFQTEFDDEVQDRVSLAHDLRQAIHDADLDAHYQLQVDLTLGCVSGFEALARWTHPRRGIIPPSRFIPIAESSHLIADIGDWMLNEVCRQGREWLDAGGAPLEMSVNLSVAQLWHRDLEKDICKALAKHDFPAELLCIELTESVFEEEALSRIEHLLKRLKDIGVRLALDDFGTGYSSMQYLNRLSFDKLKIDRSFVQGCDTCADQRRLLQGMIGLGKGLGMDVIVEGVENEDELRVVRDLGCDAVQGFCFARPKPFHEAALAAAQVEAAYGLKPVIWRAETNNVVGDVVMKSFASAGYSRTTPSIQLPTDPRARIAS